MKELFEISISESPRLRWLKHHNVHTHCSGSAEDFDGKPWNAWSGDLLEIPFWENITGATEHDAIVNLALKKGWKLWNEILPKK